MTRHRDSLPFLVALDRGLSWGEIGCTAREQSVSGTGEPRERPAETRAARSRLNAFRVLEIRVRVRERTRSDWPPLRLSPQHWSLAVL